ncbi:MAG TPA: DUF4870 domain-containing protein, partial [Ktedonobacteraceae bacterium]|nr:DUF4870 domain-containing protein [Ktedonobacteraceae bacterium]
MSWNPNQGQDPNQPSQYGGYAPQQPPQPTDPYSGQQGGGYQPNQYGPGYGQQQQQQQGYGQQQNPYGAQNPYQQPYGAPPVGAASALGPTSIGMDANILAFLAYLFPVIGALIIFFMEKQNRFVRFHAMQALLCSAAVVVLEIVLGVLGSLPLLWFFACIINPFVGLALVVCWIILMINAFQGKYFKVPIVGDYAERYSQSGT